MTAALVDLSDPGSAERVALAAVWLAAGGADRSQAILPQIMQRFGLSPKEAINAEREARLIHARAV